MDYMALMTQPKGKERKSRRYAGFTHGQKRETQKRET
jgi:hypothetical protein